MSVKRTVFNFSSGAQDHLVTVDARDEKLVSLSIKPGLTSISGERLDHLVDQIKNALHTDEQLPAIPGAMAVAASPRGLSGLVERMKQWHARNRTGMSEKENELADRTFGLIGELLSKKK